jgi:flavoprotein
MGAPAIASTLPKVVLKSDAGTSVVRDYVLVKAFDVVSSGAYRKFLLRKKEEV